VSKYEYIDSEKNDSSETNPVTKMCAWLVVSTSGFYDWLDRPESATAARRQALTVRIKHYFAETHETYGYRRIHADLVDEGTQCSPELVRQVMRTEGLVACQPKPFRVTTTADAEAVADTLAYSSATSQLLGPASSLSVTLPTSTPGPDSSIWQCRSSSTPKTACSVSDRDRTRRMWISNSSTPRRSPSR